MTPHELITLIQNIIWEFYGQKLDDKQLEYAIKKYTGGNYE